MNFHLHNRTGFATEIALINITDHILKALEAKTSAVLIMITISSVFNNVDHNILLYRISSCFGLKISALAWF